MYLSVNLFSVGVCMCLISDVHQYIVYYYSVNQNILPSMVSYFSEISRNWLRSENLEFNSHNLIR